MWMSLWLLLPVMVFSFNHSPIISSFAISQKLSYGEHAGLKSAWILRNCHVLMVITVMFFVFSCVLSLGPNDLAQAKQENISILSYLANHFQTPIIAYMAPIIAFMAIAKSFFGHYLGAREGLYHLIVKNWQACHQPCSDKKTHFAIELFMIISCWMTATINPNILRAIETLGGPIIASILFLMPMYSIAKVPAMKKYASHRVINVFITVIGLIAISAIIYNLIS
jgi:serine transporter